MDKRMKGRAPGSEGREVRKKQDPAVEGGERTIDQVREPEFGREASESRVPGEDTLEAHDGRSPMDDLIIQHLNGTLSPFEEERLRQWRERDPENEAYFQDMAEVWGLTAPEALGSLSAPPPVDQIIAAAPLILEPADTVETRSPEAPEAGSRKTPSRRTPWMGWGLLAASVAAIGLGVRVMGPGGPVPTSVHRVAEAEPVTLTLDDGSFVRLAQGATLKEWEVEGRREVSLEGRGFFAVARDENRPFVVRTEAGEVQVLGTRFQMHAGEDWMETVVVEGLVQVSNALGTAQVPAGSVVRLDAGAGPIVSEVDDVFNLLDWNQGVLVFQATPLGQVVEEVSRYFGREIVLDDADLSRRRVTAWFQGDPFEAVAESLCLVTEAVCGTEDGIVTMGLGGSGGAL